MKLSDLNPNPDNPRQISDEKLEALKRSLAEFGDLSGIIFNRKTGNLVGGHQRLKVLPENAEIHINETFKEPTSIGTVAKGTILIDGEPFIYREVEWGPVKEKAANIAANKHGGEWHLPKLAEWLLDLDHNNFDLSLTGFDKSEIEDIMAPVRAQQGQCDEDEIPEKVEPKTCLGDIYQLGNHRLMCGDSTAIDQVEAVMNGEKASLMFTSPPYADLRDYGGNLDMDTKTLSKVFDWPTDIIVINLGLIIRDREIVTYWDDYLSEAKIRGLKLLAWNIWNKGNASAPAHQQAMFGLCHEWIFVFGKYRQLNLTKPNKLFGEDSWSASTVREKDGSLSDKTSQKVRSHRQLDTVIDMVPVKNNLTGHPATFPVDLPFEYINAVTSEDEIVCEPFGGSGSTLIACEKTNRRCFMMEIDPHYCDVIVARWEKYTGKQAKLISHSKEVTGG